jgi:hypothetical protein
VDEVAGVVDQGDLVTAAEVSDDVGLHLLSRLAGTRVACEAAYVLGLTWPPAPARFIPPPSGESLF